MESNSILVRFWGVRGSIPTPGPSTISYGGNTACVEVRAGGRLLILDAGSGIRLLGTQLEEEEPLEAAIFFSHLHWDHIHGFPFFMPAFNEVNRFSIYAERRLNVTLESVLQGQMEYPNFPVTLNRMGARMEFIEVDGGDAVDLGPVRVVTSRLNHPGGCLGFRIEHGGRAVTYATDTEHLGHPDQALGDLAKGSDLLIYDAMFTDEEYQGQGGLSHKGWGHSTWREGVRVAKDAGVKMLVLFHYNPLHDDDTIAALEREAQGEWPETVASREGMIISVGVDGSVLAIPQG